MRNFNVLRFVRFAWRRWERRLSLSKRQQFVAITVVLSVGLVLTQLVSTELRYPMVAVLSLLTFFATAFGLREGLAGIEWLTLLTLPTFFTAAVGLFYFLLPVRWLTRLPVAALYAVGIYALLLTENIYNVASERTIALLRAAHSVGFLLTLVTYFLLVQTVLAFRLPHYTNAVTIGSVSFLLTVQALWSMELGERVGPSVWRHSIAMTAILTELAWILSFWPVATTLKALLLTTSLYGLVGMVQQYLAERLYKKTVIEFFSVMAIVFAIVMLATNWRGQM